MVGGGQTFQRRKIVAKVKLKSSSFLFDGFNRRRDTTLRRDKQTLTPHHHAKHGPSNLADGLKNEMKRASDMEHDEPY